MKVVVIGGGAAGMMAACAAAKKGASVTVAEQGKRLGAKLALTGNGRCNLTNRIQTPEAYRGSHPSFGYEVVSRWPVIETLSFFSEAGIDVKDKNGYYYPVNEQASVLSELLSQYCYECGVSIKTTVCVTRVAKNNGKFAVSVDTKHGREVWEADCVILACGGKSYPKTGSDGNGYHLARMLGHTVIEPHAALAPLEADSILQRFFSLTAGVRTHAKVHYDGHDETGEVQLTAYGLSGIPVLCLSRYVISDLAAGKHPLVTVDFAPERTYDSLMVWLSGNQSNGRRSIEKKLWGILHQKLASAVLDRCGLLPNKKEDSLTLSQYRALADMIKSFTVPICAVHEPEFSQVTAGGIDTDEVDSSTMESHITPRLFICGELLDVDGTCGGYNLQFAWSSGFLAGTAAGSENE